MKKILYLLYIISNSAFSCNTSIYSSTCIAVVNHSSAEIVCGGKIIHIFSGITGQSCKIEKSLISCGNDVVLIDKNKAYQIDEIIDPCGNHDDQDELIFKINGRYKSYYNGVLTGLDRGQYVTADLQSCKFLVDKTITWEGKNAN